MDTSVYTGERFVPGIEDEMLTVEHMQRYRSVVELVKGKRVLDAACGEGYGSRILADSASTVVGLDISEEAIKRAQENYGDRENLSYCVGSIASLPFENSSLDAIISFETIEHVDEEMQNAFLKEARRVLKTNGIFIISTPNKKIYSDLHNYHNEFHVKEFYVDEFIRFLKQSFLNVKLFDQYFEVASVIDGQVDSGSAQKALYYRSEQYEGEGKYVIALASDGPVDAFEIRSILIGKNANYLNGIDRILTLQHEEEERNQHIKFLDGEIAERDANIRKFQKELEVEKAKYIEIREEYSSYRKSIDKRVEKLFSMLEEDIGNKNERIAELKKKIESLQNSLIKQGQKYRDLEDRFVECMRLRKKAEEGNADRMEVLETEIRNKDAHIQQLLETEREYEREKKTRLYRLNQKIRKICGFFIPANSRREFLLYVLMQCFRHPKLMLKMINPTRVKNYLLVSRKEGMNAVWENYRLTEEYEQNKLNSVPKAIVKDIEQEEKAIEEYPILKFRQTEKPLVSIVIPVYNQFSYTYECLRSIQENTGEIDYEIIIGDDCSDDNTRYIGKVVEGIRIITNEENLRFLRNCNHAAAYARGEYILFLNNDTQVQKDWLRTLVDLIESDTKIGMVGSKLLYPDGFLQEAGGIIWKDGSGWNYGNRQNPNNSEFCYVREVDYISGAAIMIRKNLWEEIGGFDERYVPAYCEDSDLAFEVRKHGYKVMYQPKSEVIHFEGISNGTDLSAGQKQYQVENQKKFYEKWKDVLEKEQFDNGTHLFLARDRSRYKKHILVIDHYVPQYDKDAGSKTTFMYLKQMLRMGLHVTFIGDNFFQHEPYTTELQKLGILVLYGPVYAQHWKDFIQENAGVFDYYYLNRPHITIKYIDFIRENTKGKIIYYGHDLHFLREYRQYELTGDKKDLESSEHWKRIEFDIYSKSDVIYVPGSYEQEYLSKLVHNVPVRNLPAYIYEQEKQNVNLDFDARQGLLFVGGFGHPPNESGVLWFAKEVFPKVVEKIPNIKWYIVGSKVTLAVEKLASDHIIVLGFVSDERLEELYNECRVVVVPLLVGAGVKGKVVEAIYNRTPMVTTSVGAEGLSTDEGAFLVKDGAGEMAEAIIDLYNDEEALRKMSENCRAFIRKYFAPESARAILSMDIDA
mgnify:CR=1 FL=1